MLNCVYHPIDEMRVVDDEEKARLLATGHWFDHPLKAKEVRERHEQELRGEQEHPKPQTRKERRNDER